MRNFRTPIWRIGILFCFSLFCSSFQAEEKKPLKIQLQELEKKYSVHFVYDAALPVWNTPVDAAPADLSLERALHSLLSASGLSWKRDGDYILLVRTERRITWSGYVYAPDGETLMNATVRDMYSDASTMTNARGYYSIELPAGSNRVRFSFTGFQPVEQEVRADADLRLDIVLKEQDALREIVVTEDRNHALNTTQTGKVSLTGAELNRGFSMMSSPDLVKSLQLQAGVHPGAELTSGLFVHGGGADENLFLLDGTPVYQVGHLGGLFSAFNTDAVKQVDFYKSGFPARYGGRLSSVTDIRTRDGDFQQFHGSFSVGLLDGRLQLEGPLVKDRTAFHLAMRRSWADLFTAPVFALYNLTHKDEVLNGRYAFQDVNAKITHRFSERSKADIAFYMGDDLMKYHNDYQIIDPYGVNDGNCVEEEKKNFRMRWGNISLAAGWDYIFSPRFYSRFSMVYARNTSNYRFTHEETERKEGKEQYRSYEQEQNRSVIDDAGYRMEFDFLPNNRHHLRFGSNYLMHWFRPQNMKTYSEEHALGAPSDTLSGGSRYFDRVHELSFYGEDEIELSRRFRMNLGVHYTAFGAARSIRHSVEPRLSLLYRVSDTHSLKASYTEMSQFVHLLSNTYLSLPLDFWVPATRKVRPMRSRQVSLGVYGRLPGLLSYTLEGYYKTMNHLLDYNGGSELIPNASHWDERITEGRGRAYGMDLSVDYVRERLSLSAQYTLSWSERQFDAYGPHWFYDRFDHRHILQLQGRYRFRKMDLYAAWMYRSGDRMTLPVQRVSNPWLPDAGQSPVLGGETQVAEYPNNIKLPNYHRLDVGMNFYHRTKRGFERIWNVSVYNAYCRLNPLYTEVVQQKDGSYKGRSVGYIPLIPSFSYTLKF